MQSRHVQQPARADGVLELLGRDVLRERWRGRERDMPELSIRTVVAGGQPELQSMPRELAGGGLERVYQQLRLRRGLFRPERRRVRAVRGRQLQGLVRREPVRGVPGADELGRYWCELFLGVYMQRWLHGRKFHRTVLEHCLREIHRSDAEALVCIGIDADECSCRDRAHV
jgi:hypothetical protein